MLRETEQICNGPVALFVLTIVRGYICVCACVGMCVHRYVHVCVHTYVHMCMCQKSISGAVFSHFPT